MLTLSMIINLFAALFLGTLIGLERQWRKRLSGLRLNALVCVGSCSFVIFAQLFPEELSPTRVAAQVVSGIGFIGAGALGLAAFVALVTVFINTGLRGLAAQVDSRLQGHQ